MTRLTTEIAINRSIEPVFDYVTPPAHWPTWHPSSLYVSGATDHSLRLGEQVTEDFRVAGRTGRVVWTVREPEAPRRWLIQAEVKGGGGGGTVGYTLAPSGGTSLFRREFIYRTPGLIFRLLDAFILRRRIDAESAQALRNLKRVLEAS